MRAGRVGGEGRFVWLDEGGEGEFVWLNEGGEGRFALARCSGEEHVNGEWGAGRPSRHGASRTISRAVGADSKEKAGFTEIVVPSIKTVVPGTRPADRPQW